MPGDQQAAQTVTRNAYQEVHDAISRAREVCVDGSRADLRHKAEQVQAVLTGLDQDDLKSDTAAFEDVGKKVYAVNADLVALKAKITTIVQDVAVAARVVSAIDSAVTAAGQFCV